MSCGKNVLSVLREWNRACVKNLDVSRYLYITLSHYFFFGLTSDHMNLCIIITMKQKGFEKDYLKHVFLIKI